MNFSHFTDQDILLQNTDLSVVLHLLLRQQQALQLASTEPDFDILLPVYFGNIEKEFDPSRASAIVISVKNRGAASQFPLKNEMFSHTKDPVLCILVDLGIRGEPAVDVQLLPKGPKGPSKQVVYGIHAVGAGVNTYGCLQGLGLEDACRALLEQVLQTRDPRGVRDKHEKFCHRNKIGSYLTGWEELYPAIKELEHGERKAKERDAEQPDAEEQNTEEEDVMEQDT
jgi:hypothetical protein